MRPEAPTEPGTRTRPPITAVLLLGLAVMAVSSSAVLVRWADASPIALAIWRTAGGAVILAVPAWRSADRPRRRDWTLLAVAGVALGVHFATWLASLELTSVAASVALVSLAPLLIAAYLWATGRPPSRRSWVAAALALAGVLVIGGSDALAGGTALGGDALALVGAATMAVYLVLGDRLRTNLSTAAYAARAYAVAAASLVPVAAVFGVALWGFDRTTWLAIAAMIVGPQLAGHTVFNLLLKPLGPITVSLALLAEPVGATLLVWLVFAELPPLASVVGAPLIMLGLYLQITARRPQRSAQTSKRPSANDR